DGTREQFLPEKILNGLVRSCEKRPVRYQQLEDITNNVEWKLRDEGRAEISSREIGEHVMNLLMHVDQVSYVRFASVYKEFKDVDQLLQSMQGILAENKRSDSYMGLQSYDYGLRPQDDFHVLRHFYLNHKHLEILNRLFTPMIGSN